MKEALLYKKLDGEVNCFLCSHRCRIKENKTGVCGVRKNIKGVLYSLVYGKVIAAHVDPIEKKPLYHFFPGTTAYSIATVGCNFRCKNCQNADISQMPREFGEIRGVEMTPDDVVWEAKENRCMSIAYTYTEPTVFFEYAFDVSKLAKKEGIYNVYVSNGFMSEEMLEYSRGLIDAANIDIKSFSDKFYKEVCGARLEPVLQSCKKMKEMGVWLEITTLLIPGLNDSEEELKEIAAFIKKELGAETPWHISRFHPDYKLMNVSATKPESVRHARKIGLDEGLRYVYTGNLPGDEGENTFCPKCKTKLVERNTYFIEKNIIRGGRCPECGEKIEGRWV